MIICGLDECGRGPLAGPIVGAATILKPQFPIHKLRDSKKLKPRQIKDLSELIRENSIWVIEMISVRQINSRGIGWANKEIFRRIIKKLEADSYIVDGNLKIRVKGKSKSIKSVIKADATIPEVMAASIIAKHYRDEHMIKLHEKHMMYGWQTNVGYGTKYHIAALREHGPCKHHRKLFVRTALKERVARGS